MTSWRAHSTLFPAGKKKSRFLHHSVFCIRTSSQALSTLALSSMPHADKVRSRAHVINAYTGAHAALQRELRWGIGSLRPPPPPPYRHPWLLRALQAAASLKPASPDKRWSVVGLRERERRNMRKARGQLSEIVSGLGGSKERVRSNKGEAPNACCVCSGKAVPGAPVASAGMCAGKKIAGGFDRV